MTAQGKNILIEKSLEKIFEKLISLKQA